LEIEKGEKLMKPLKNRLVQAVAALGVVATLALVTPRAAHALAAALVQVANTSANPVVTQSVPSQAAQLVGLIGYVAPNVTTGQSLYVAGGPEIVGYSVPNDRSLVVTAVDITPPFGCTNDTIGIGLVGVANYTVSAPNTGHFKYPSGIVFPSGTAPLILSYGVTSTAGECFEATHVNMYGYLTSN
jgi:hypothetical protein